MRLADALDGVKLLCVETAPFIYFTEARPGYTDKVRAIFTHVEAESLELVVSVIALTETLIKPLRDGDASLVQAYTELFSQTDNIRLQPVDSVIARKAAELCAKYNLRTPDALHVATALETRCDAFLTNDRGLKRVTDVKVLILDDLDL